MITTTQIGTAMTTARFVLSKAGGVVSNGLAETNKMCQIVRQRCSTLNCYDWTVMCSTVGWCYFVGGDK